VRDYVLSLQESLLVALRDDGVAIDELPLSATLAIENELIALVRGQGPQRAPRKRVVQPVDSQSVTPLNPVDWVGGQRNKR
jgi:hypothetical protein